MLGQVVQAQGVADAGDDVLALRVDQVVAVGAGVAGRRVTGERDAGAAVLAEVAEHHGADVDGGAQVLRDPFPTPVQPGAVGVPGVEDGADRHVQLLARVLREFLARALVDRDLVFLDERLHVVDVELGVGQHALGGLRLVQRVGENVAGHVQHGLAEHHQQPPVGIPGESLVAGFLGEALDAGIVQADVQHGFHHSGHREFRAGTHAHQQRIVPVAQPPAEVVLQVPQRHRHLHPQFAGFGAQCQVFPAGLGGDGEPGRHGQTQSGHLGEVGALPAEQIFLILVALGEIENELGHRPWLLCRHLMGT